MSLMPKIKLDLTDSNPRDKFDNNENISELVSGLPSVSEAKKRNLIKSPRVQFSFTNVPLPIKKAFIEEASKRGITQKQLLYEALKGVGIDIPTEFVRDRRRNY